MSQLQGGVSCPVKQGTPRLGHQYYTGVGRLGSQRSNRDFIRPRSQHIYNVSDFAGLYLKLAPAGI